MKKLILSSLAVALVAVAANAGTPVVKQVVPCGDIGLGFYGALQGGINAYSAVGHEYGRTDNYVLNGNGDRYIEKTKSTISAMAGLKLGYVFKTDALVRPVLELDSYWVQSRMQFDSTDIYKTGGATTDTYYNSAKLHANTYATMVNGIAKFDLGSFQPYAGLGIGLATTGWTGSADSTEKDGSGHVTNQNHYSNVGNDSSSTFFAFQAIAGADYYFARNMSVFAEYKFLNVCGDGGSSSYYKDGYSGSQSTNLRNNIVAAGVRYHF